MRKATASIAWIIAVAGTLSTWVAAGNGDRSGITHWVLAGLAGPALVVALLAGTSSLRMATTTAVGAALVTWAAVLAARTSLSPSGLDARDVSFVVAQSYFAIILAVLSRRRLRTDLSSVIPDGLIVGLGAWIALWVVLLGPALDGFDGTASTAVLRAIGLAVMAVVLFLAATVMFSETAPSPSVLFLIAGVVLVGAGQVLYLVDARDSTSVGALYVRAPFVNAGFLAVAVLLHPSSRTLMSPARRRTTPPLMMRLVATTASMAGPIVLLALTDPRSTSDRAVRTASVSVLAVAVMARVIQSVRANAGTQRELLRNARTDALTSLPNRSAMLDLIAAATEAAWGTPRQPTVLFIDVDRFKNINDSLGHSAGDSVLLEVSRRLLSAVPLHATVGRISGDEFVVLDPTTETATQAAVLAETLLDCLREPVTVAGGDMFVSASIGVAMAVRNLDLTADDILRHADTAMYRAKAAGRNCIAFFDDSMVERVTQRLDIETALYRALERNEVRLVHQPIVDTDLGLVIGFEALMRWDRGPESGGTVSPADFIPVAEETGTIVPLGSWALLDALNQMRLWIDAGVCTRSTSVSVNVSARQLHDPSFVPVVTESLSRAGIPADQLWLEVTESVMITEPELALTALRSLNAMGVRVAVDDFGTGYSSLSLLQRFPIQRIKVDRAFVQALTSDPASHSIVRTIIAMAESLGADVVAEGVETEAQLMILRALSCTKAQGYLISHPVPASDVPGVVSAVEDSPTWRR